MARQPKQAKLSTDRQIRRAAARGNLSVTAEDAIAMRDAVARDRETRGQQDSSGSAS